LPEITTWDEAVEVLARHLYPLTDKTQWSHESALTLSYYRTLARHALRGVDAHIINLAHLKGKPNA